MPAVGAGGTADGRAWGRVGDGQADAVGEGRQGEHGAGVGVAQGVADEFGGHPHGGVNTFAGPAPIGEGVAYRVTDQA
ncbi:hypothetical protein B4N89_42380 [Embleya scabrispora]|uniref:Uncharacterized protein n=1 Tax=Embleya scabrispora TaxID=159449 RepID=A0A1T3NK21_9ACTN|nr:hypothetical protein B4N89_42380 [Embleya scabrispora]